MLSRKWIFRQDLTPGNEFSQNKTDQAVISHIGLSVPYDSGGFAVDQHADPAILCLLHSPEKEQQHPGRYRRQQNHIKPRAPSKSLVLFLVHGEGSGVQLEGPDVSQQSCQMGDRMEARGTSPFPGVV